MAFTPSRPGRLIDTVKPSGDEAHGHMASGRRPLACKKKENKLINFFSREINFTKTRQSILRSRRLQTPPQIVISSENLAIYCKMTASPIKNQFF